MRGSDRRAAECRCPVRSESRAALFACLAFSACTLGRTDVEDCTLDSECREAFGIASLCGDDGYCQVFEPQERCRATFPGDFEENPGRYPNILLVGTIIDEGNEVHRARARAVEVAIQDANEQGGLVDGRQFGLVVCDNGDRPTIDSLGQDDASVAVATWLRDVAEVAFIVGPPSSGSTLAVYENVDDVLIISPSASSDRLTGIDTENPTDDMPGTLWRTAVPDGQQAPQIAADIMARGITNLAIVYASGPYGDSLAELVTRELSGVTVVDYAFENEGVLSMRLSEVASSAAEEVLFISSNTDQIASFINVAGDRTALDTRSFFLTDAAANSSFTASVTDESVLARVRGTRPVQVMTPEFETFVSRYAIRFGTTDVRELSFTSNAFDAAWLGLYGMSWAIEQEPDLGPSSIATGIRKLTGGGASIATTTPSSWLTMQSEFRSGNPIDVTGASGNLDYDLGTEELSGEFEVWVVQDGAIVTAP